MAGQIQARRGLVVEICLVSISDIRPTEETVLSKVELLREEIEAYGFWTRPIVVDDSIHALMDGHHRLQAAKLLKLKVIPAFVLSYDDPFVRLASWRPDLEFSPDDVRRVAAEGSLLPYKSTCHIISRALPQCRIALQVLRDMAAGQFVAAAPRVGRLEILAPFYREVVRKLEVRALGGADIDTESAESKAPHPLLRRQLLNDPAMAALLPAAASRLSLGHTDDVPFVIQGSGLIRLPSSLLSNVSALAVAARWGLEAAFFQSNGPLGDAELAAILRHGASLLKSLTPADRNLLIQDLPVDISAELLSALGHEPSHRLTEWQRSLIEEGILAQHAPAKEAPTAPPSALTDPIEKLLVAGGDTRLHVDARTGLNRYGVPPRPRPEAIHFSSSTASSISEYSFMFCDVLRRDLHSAVLHNGRKVCQLRAQLIDVFIIEIAKFLGVFGDVDGCLLASGTDAELVSVMLALAGGNEPLTNILVAPDETGRNTVSAGRGQFFDIITANGVNVEVGKDIWPERDIEIIQIPIRGRDSTPRAPDEVDADVVASVEGAVSRGRRVLVHVLRGSKTGLSGPSDEAIFKIKNLSSERVDVVIDACQMRTSLQDLGRWLNEGCILQVTGSKYLTGPPFSGALLIPTHLRTRRMATSQLLRNAPGVCRHDDWTIQWRTHLNQGLDTEAASFGPIFRWFAALLEATLYVDVPETLKRYAFRRLQSTVRGRIEISPNLVLDGSDQSQNETDLTTQSIVSFSVLIDGWNRQRTRLDASGCQRLFQLLNTDVSNVLGPLSEPQRSLAMRQIHIGQPVTLMATNAADPITFLRFVIGARFFTIVGQAASGALEAALESEIADALCAIKKLELIAQRWWHVRLAYES